MHNILRIHAFWQNIRYGVITGLLPARINENSIKVA